MVGLVGLAVARSPGDRRSNHGRQTEFANRRGIGQGQIGAGGEARTDPRGVVAGVGMVTSDRTSRAILRQSMVVIRVVLVTAERLGVVTRHGVMGPLVRQSGNRRTDHQQTAERSNEPSRQGSNHHWYW